MPRFRDIRRKRHQLPDDYTCKRCGWLVKALIPHECDPSICTVCDGSGLTWVGRDKETDEFVGNKECDVCEGTGKTIWAD